MKSLQRVILVSKSKKSPQKVPSLFSMPLMSFESKAKRVINRETTYEYSGTVFSRGGGGTWIQNDGGVHAYDSFCEPALEKIAKNHTRH